MNNLDFLKPPFSRDFTIGVVEIKEGQYRPIFIRDNRLYMKRFGDKPVEITRENMDELKGCKVLAFKAAMDELTIPKHCLLYTSPSPRDS